MCLIVGIGYLSSEKEVSEGDAEIQLVFDLGLSSNKWKGTYLPETLILIERRWHHLKDPGRNIMMENVLRKG